MDTKTNWEEEFDFKKEPEMEKIRQFIYERPSHIDYAEKNWNVTLKIIKEILETEKAKWKREMKEWADKNYGIVKTVDGNATQTIKVKDLLKKLNTL